MNYNLFANITNVRKSVIPKRLVFVSFLGCLLVVLFPTQLLYPISKSEYSHFSKRSYWYYPWGESLTHKGIDIFATKRSNVLSPISGIVVQTNTNKNGGNYIYILGPGTWIHYFAHLDTVLVTSFSFVTKGEIIGKVGNTGNALCKQPHLHYSIFTAIPYIWNYDEFSVHGYLKMFYLNPTKYFAK